MPMTMTEGEKGKEHEFDQARPDSDHHSTHRVEGGVHQLLVKHIEPDQNQSRQPEGDINVRLRHSQHLAKQQVFDVGR